MIEKKCRHTREDKKGKAPTPLTAETLPENFYSKRLIFYQVLARHVGRLFQPHDMQDGRCYVGQNTISTLASLLAVT